MHFKKYHYIILMDLELIWDEEHNTVTAPQQSLSYKWNHVQLIKVWEKQMMVRRVFLLTL